MVKEIAAPNHIIALELDGKLTLEDIQSYRRIAEEKLQQHEQVGIYVDLTKLADTSANALIEGAKADMEVFSHIEQLTRCALVSDKEWPQVMISFVRELFPRPEMKVFPEAQKEQAMKWAAETPEMPASKDPAVRFLPTTRDEVLAFEIDGVMTAEEMPGVIRKLEQFLAEHDRVRLLNRVKQYGGFDPSILMQSGLFSMKLSAMEKVDRYAIVGAPGWMRKIIDAMNPLFPDIDMRTFAADQESEAWAWLGAGPAE
ncbi:STAS/SEC14 domain-containing protein [Marinobacter piscensis]|uniref:STAS/SEC14 domain-containing protein n=1 Tax=Marinobacter piscensis TaxID=1562308 RepID=UPI0011A7B19C|nr:STAS/SEC14 domain-containing protein [Marinobacter piscensis]